MNFEDLQKLWNATTPGAGPQLPQDRELIALAQRDDAKFDQMIRARDRREITAAVTLATFFAVTGLIMRHYDRTAWPFAVTAAAMLFVGAFILTEKRIAHWRAGPPPETVLGELDAAHRHVARQIWLLKHVAWWYLIPAQAGWLLFYLALFSASCRCRWQFCWGRGSSGGSVASSHAACGN